MSQGEGTDQTQITCFWQDNPTGLFKYSHRDIMETQLTILALFLSVWALACYKNLSGSVPVLALMKAVSVCVFNGVFSC